MNALGSLLLASADGGSFWLPPEGSTAAADIDWLFWLIFYLCTFFFVAIIAATIYFSLKYRRVRPDQPPLPSPHHNTPLEVFWSAVPLGLVIWIFYMGFEGFMRMQTPPEGAYTIDVTAEKWAWTFRYSNGSTSQDGNLHVPPGEPVRLLMQAKDVLHAFYAPALRVKQDLVPGRYTQLWFEALPPTPAQLETTVRAGETTLGEVAHRLQLRAKDLAKLNDLHGEKDAEGVEKFDGVPLTEGATLKLPGAVWHMTCAEYCGTGHSAMFRKVVVHPDRASFDAWLAEQGVVEKTIDNGRMIYQSYCATCHSTVPGERKIGPSWGDLANDLKSGASHTMSDGTQIPVDENYILESVMDPGLHVVQGYKNEMSVFRGTLKQDHVSAVILYIRSLAE
jgi:cytochrome c oxidase subunit II